jgi:hypothetical protein
MAERTVETLLRFVNDKQATNAILKDNQRIDGSLDDIARTAEKTEEAYDRYEAAAQRAAKASRDAAEVSIRAAKEQSELLGDVAGRTSQLSGALSGLGALGGQRLMIAADILDAAEAAKLLRAEFPAMISQMVAARGQLLLLGGVGGALAVGMIALNKYNEMQQRSKQILEEVRQSVANYIARLVDLNTFLVGASGADIEARKQDLKKELEGIQTTRQQVLDEIESQQARIRAAYLDGRLTGSELQDIATAGFTIDRLSESLPGLNQQIGALEGDIVLLGDAAEKAAEKTRRAVEPIDKYGNDIEVAANAQGTLNKMQRESAERTAMQAKYEDVLKKEREKQIDAARKLADEEAALADQRTEAIHTGALAIVQAELDRAAVFAETEQEIADTQREFAQKRKTIIATAEEEIARNTADYITKRGEIERDHRETVDKLTEAFYKDQADRLKDFQRDQRRAQQDHRDAMLDAAGKLDAIALLDEQRNFTKDQQRAKEDFKEEQSQRDREFKDKLKQEDQAFKKSMQQAERAYRDREVQLRNHLNRQLSDLRSAQTQEMARIRSHQAQRLSEIDRGLENDLRKLTGYNANELLLRQSHYDTMKAKLQTFVNEANAIVGGLSTGGAVGSSYYVPNTPGAVGQFPLAAGVRSMGGFTSPLASPLAMMPPVARSTQTVNNTPQITNQFNGMDRLTPGQIRNVVKIVTSEMQRQLA